MALHAWLAACTLGTASPAAVDPDPGQRWPTWPTEIDHIAAPLLELSEHPGQERARVLALTTLEPYATPLLEPVVVRALRDPSSQVRREALRICYERRLEGCVAPALEMWGEGGDPGLRMETLKLLAWDGREAAVATLIGALRHANEQMRAEAAGQLGLARLTPAEVAEARSALLAKLADPSALVRRRVALALGVLGPGEGTLALARLLEDPEPAVRSAGAEALGRFGDRRAVPALLRALEAPNEASVRLDTLRALARLPGDEVVSVLLDYLDAPPGGVSAGHIADALAVRPHPEPALIDGLIARLREPMLRDPALHVLLIHAPQAEPALREALARGLEPSLALELERILAALDPARAASTTRAWARPWPASEDVEGWSRLLDRGTWRARFEAAAALAALETTPEWLVAAVVHRLHKAVHPEPLRPWLAAMSTRDSKRTFDPLAAARLWSWVRDEGQSAGDRCLAVLALASTSATPGTWNWVAGEPASEVRACAWLAAARVGASSLEQRALGLLDAAPHVRLAAVVALALDRGRWSGQLTDRVGMLGRIDPDPDVRHAAQHVLETRLSPPWIFAVQPRDASPRARARAPFAPVWTSAGVRWSFGPTTRNLSTQSS